MASPVTPLRPVLLIIRDGWGEDLSPAHAHYNAVRQAKTPWADHLSRHWPQTTLMTHGLDVGLPPGVMGNSEVGHQNIGAGRVVDQERVRIDKAFANGSLADNPVLQAAFERAKKGGCLHFMGLLSDAGVHSILAHLFGLWELAVKAGVTSIALHAFTDGRDAPQKSGVQFIEKVEAFIQTQGVGHIASVMGRFWAMDRDKRWDRIEAAYQCLTGDKVERTAPSARAAVEGYYAAPLDAARVGDEFVLPTVIMGPSGAPAPRIRSGDSVIFFNFRGDRPRELTHAFVTPDFHGFPRGDALDVHFVTLTAYEEGLCPNVLFQKPPKMTGTLGEVISKAGLQQFRCAETEKYPHVTFFFNDYRDEPFPGEDRGLAPSPREVSTYDQKPEMSASGITQAALAALLSKKYALTVVNYANADMVGHTGSLAATIKACEAVDAGVGALLQAVDEIGGGALITADHGNAEMMWDVAVQSPHTRHTTNPVECILYGKGYEALALRSGGRLADIAPTILQCLGLPQPVEMTGESLLADTIIE